MAKQFDMRNNKSDRDLVMNMRHMAARGHGLDVLFKRAGWRRIALYDDNFLSVLACEFFQNTDIEVVGLIYGLKKPSSVPPLKAVPAHDTGSLGEIDVIACTGDNFLAAYTTLREYTAVEVIDLREFIIPVEIIDNYLGAKEHVTACGASFHLFNTYLPTLRLQNRTLREKSLIKLFGVTSNFDMYYPVFAELNKSIPHYSNEYLAEIMSAPPLVETIFGSRNADVSGPYLNVVNGVRMTTDSPDEFDNTIYLYGICTIFGMGVEDSLTIASQLQRMLNAAGHGKRWRVVNAGVFGGSDNPVLCRLAETAYAQGDICVTFGVENDVRVLQYCEPPERKIGVVADLTSAFDRPHDMGEVFTDFTHFTHGGAYLLARKIHETLTPALQAPRPDPGVTESATKAPGPVHRDAAPRQPLDEYISYLEKEREEATGLVGGIVMNCNPFTLGHRYLIEFAAKQVERLYVFCLEEDKSYFSFTERFALLREGTKDIGNVKVLKGGKFIISALTFPEYFSKENVTEVTSLPTQDVELFARHIAPALNIGVRFAGQEPFCAVTRYYNQMMRDILPRHGIEFREIGRLERDGSAISASRVRKLMREGRLDLLRELVPDSTFMLVAKKMKAGIA